MSSDVSFRPAREDDLPAIVALLADDALGSGREKPGVPLHPAYLAAFAEIAADSNQLQAVAEDADGAIVGCLQITVIPGLGRLGTRRGQIESVRVRADRRGGGIGAAMMAWAVEECRRRGCGLVQLTTDRTRPQARRFYERLGFVASHEGMKLAL